MAQKQAVGTISQKVLGLLYSCPLRRRMLTNIIITIIVDPVTLSAKT